MSVISRHWNIGVCLSLAALLFFQSAGWFVTWGVLQLDARKAARIALDKSVTPLRTKTIPLDLFSRMRVGKKEIRLDGHLYDIKNQQIKGDSITLVLYHDRDEEAILHTLSSWIAPESVPGVPHSAALQHWLAKWLGAPFLLPASPRLLPTMPVAIVRHTFSFLAPPAQSTPGNSVPPPRRYDAVFSEVQRVPGEHLFFS